MNSEADSIYTFLRDEGLTYRGTLIELVDLIAQYLRDGSGDSMARASELTKSLQRLIDLGETE